MAPPTEQELRDLARETRYRGHPLEKMIRLLDILQAIERDGFLRGRLALKGGTALHAFHLGLKRLSMDIDLNYLGPHGDDEWLSERGEVDAAVTRIVAEQGYRVEESRAGPLGSRWDLRFASALGGTASLKVDLSYIDRQPLFGASRMPSVDLGGRKATDILVLDLEDVIAGELAALTRRTLARDLFDARGIMSIDGLDWAGIRTAFFVSAAASPSKWRDRDIDARGADPHEACQNLLICLPHRHFRGKDETAAWYNESMEICRERFGGLLEPTDPERMFLDGVQTRGEVDADLLDAPPELRARIAASPRLAWRCRKVRERGEAQALSVRRRPSRLSMGI